MYKLFIKDIFFKPCYNIIAALTVMFAVVLMYIMLSYNNVVTDMEYGNAYADCGEYDIVIAPAAESGGNFVATTMLRDFENIDGYVGVLEFYISYNHLGSDYSTAFVRAFEQDEIEKIHSINYGSKIFDSASNMNDDQLIISSYFAKQNNLNLNSSVDILLNGKTRTAYVAAIAEDSGYFYGKSDTMITSNQFIAAAYGINFGHIYNRVYVNAAKGEEKNVLKALSDSSFYGNFSVNYTADNIYVSNNIRTFNTTFSICAIALALSAMLIVYKIFSARFQSNNLTVSRLKILGATNARVAALFTAESAAISLAGSILGAGTAALCFYLIVKATAGISYAVIWRNIFISTASVFVMSLLTAVIPVIKASRISIKNAMTDAKITRYRTNFALMIILSAGLTLSLILEFTLKKSIERGYAAMFSLIFAMLASICVMPYVMRGVGKLVSHAKNGIPHLVSNEFLFNRHTLSSMQLLLIGSIFCILATSVSNTFTGFADDILTTGENTLYATRVDGIGDARMSEFCELEGVERATAAYYIGTEKCYVNGMNNFEIYALDSALNIDDILPVSQNNDFESMNSVLNDTSKDYILIFSGLVKLQDYKLSDTITLEYNGISHDYIVGGIICGKTPGYKCIVNKQRFTEYYHTVDYNSVYIKTFNINTAMDNLRTHFSSDKIEVIEMRSLLYNILQRSYSLITFLNIITAFIMVIVGLAAVLIIVLGELNSGVENQKLMLLGATNKMLNIKNAAVGILGGGIYIIAELTVSALCMLFLYDAAVVANLFNPYNFAVAKILPIIFIFAAVFAFTVPIFRLLFPYKIDIAKTKIT